MKLKQFLLCVTVCLYSISSFNVYAQNKADDLILKILNQKQPPRNTYTYLLSEPLPANVYLLNGDTLLNTKVYYDIASRLLEYGEGDMATFIPLKDIEMIDIQYSDAFDNVIHRKYLNGAQFEQGGVPLEGLFEVYEEGAYTFLLKHHFESARKRYKHTKVTDGKATTTYKQKKRIAFYYVLNPDGEISLLSGATRKDLGIFGVYQDLIYEFVHKKKHNIYSPRTILKMVRYANELYKEMETSKVAK